MTPGLDVYVYRRESYAHRHRFADEVALTAAGSLKEAVARFRTTYEFASESNVRVVCFDRPVIHV